MFQLTDTSTILQQVQQAGVKQIRFLYCDTAGIIRGKICGSKALAGRMESGIGLMRAAQALNGLDQLQNIEGLGPVGEVRLVPDPRTFRLLPYAPHSAAMLCDLLELDGTPWENCPRTFLRQQLERAQSEVGLTFLTAFEPEWTLARRGPDGSYTAIDDSLGYSTLGMTTPAAVIDEIVTALEAQNLPIELYHPELGHGQQELTISAATALQAADNQLFYRETIRTVAWNQGLIASFAPKPFTTQAGNGCHVHLSAWAGDRGDINLFYDAQDRYQLSQLGYYFIGGILHHLPALVALTCPTVNSYRRLKPQSWASSYVCCGPDNREAAVRIVSPLQNRESATLNLEIRAVDNTSNPYLALGGIIVAGLDGVLHKRHPGEDLLLLTDPASLSEEERTRRGIRRLPDSLEAALNLLEKDEVLMKALGPTLAQTYLTVKRSEVAAFAAQGLSFEIDQHFYKY